MDNPDMKMLGSTANAGEQAAAEQAAAEAAQAEAQQEALAQESQEAAGSKCVRCHSKNRRWE